MNAIARIAPPPAVRPSARIAARAVRCLRLEINTHPKPGLVSHVDNGAHGDMDAALLRRSADSLRPFFAGLAAAGAAGACMQDLRCIGMAAESAMLAATGGVNTHRGAIFGLGLLAAAAGFRQSRGSTEPLGRIVAEQWGAAIRGNPAPTGTHGAAVTKRFGVGGARAEASLGFPSVYRVALPALEHAARLRGPDCPSHEEAARVHACFALIAVIDDTNLLHRGGAAGLAHAKRKATSFLRSGSVMQPAWEASARAIHADFTARNLSPGGAADLLAMALFVQQSPPGAI